MSFDFSPLDGLSVNSIEKIDYSWFFRLTDKILISTESLWRFVSSHRVYVTSEDHGHQFGLPQPVDAAVRVLSALSGATIVQAHHNLETGDLFVDFTGHQYLQFLQMSGGYESWRLLIQDVEYICLGGGAVDSYFAK